ncbi:hypothetical protein H2203_004354 [Taxawa tesnikishii (nom. ined.)]|nr:hypothetical protein H2203_004354 [Dothideales sp. JES 119]
MDTGHLSVSAPAGTKHKQVQDAKDMQRLITDRCNKNGTSVPPYEFLELIGKGSFGRVYKCRKRNVTPDEFVAIKILDVDALDASVDHMEKDETIKDFLKEVNTLLLLRESKAKNINPIQEAFDLHSQLWIVSEYCPGGSVHTLMKASPSPGLEEQYIIPIARELAVAMKYVHDVDIIHRDIKCGNVLISEEGQLQLCDFGIAATVQTETNEGKRTTIIGTPNWMAPEMINILGSHDEQIRYGKEVDLWAYGCTIYEMATGFPPNHTFHPSMLRKVLKTAPRLEGGTYSEELREFVAFCLQERPQDRPNADQILNHSYIANTEQEYPTKKTLDLLNRYHLWERQGDQSNDTDEWNFSTSDNFNEAFDNRMSRIGIGISTTDFADQDNRNSSGFGQFGATMAAQRGERSLQRIFDQNAESYDYNTSVEEQPLSDLPLRNLSSGRAANRETLIDLDMDFAGLEYQPTFDFNDVATIRASRALRNSIQPDVEDNEYYDAQGQDTRRATRDWKFPSIAPPQDNANRKTQDWSFAMAQTLTTAEENANRKTLDWSFTDAQSLTAPAQGNPNRRTQDWSFETAQPMEPADDDLEFTFSSPAQDEAELSFPTARNTSELAPGFRPALKHTATEPIGQFNDFYIPSHSLQ